jgi:hypothetical protein
MVGPNEKYLFDVSTPEGEVKNLLTALPKVSATLETKLLNWNSSLPSPSLPRVANKADESFFDTHVKKIVN